MRHGPAGRRLRNRGNGGGGNPPNGNNGGGVNPRRVNNGGGNRNQVFDSNGPDVRIRGTAHQIQEKYATLAKDAASSGDLILAESYLQHAEHYQRIIGSWIEQQPYVNRETQSYEDDDQEEVGYRSNDRRFDVRPNRPQQQDQSVAGVIPGIAGESQPVRQDQRQSELTEA